MKNNNESSNTASNASRRQFLGGSVALGGAVVLSGLTTLSDQANAQGAEPTELVLKLNDNPDLGKVGGWKIFELGEESVIVANTETGYVACSSKCTHKGCDVEYRAEAKAFVCPCHGARFDTTGAVLRGPAKLPLKQFDAQTALIVGNKKAK